MMKTIIFISFLMLGFIGFAQDGRVIGKVLDAEYNEQPLAFAAVKVKGLDLQVVTDEFGNYDLNLLPGTYTLEVDFIGYEKTEITNIEVTTEELDLGAVVLQGRSFMSDNSLASKGQE